MTNRRFPALFASLLVCVATGCARYEYDLVRPPELAGHVGSKAWDAFPLDGLEYRLRTSDNRLVMLVYNRGEGPVKLSGADSAAVDPRGESHPLPSRTIAPDSYIKLILPPPRPQVRSYGPTFGLGVGVGYSRLHGYPYRDGFGRGYGAYDGIEPRYYTIYDRNDRTYFAWPGGTELRLLLAYERGDGGGRPGGGGGPRGGPGGADDRSDGGGGAESGGGGGAERFRHELVFRRVRV